MSKLEELIQEYCPDGVEYVKIGEIVNYEQPSKYIVRSTDYNDSFPFPVLTAGQSFILGYTNEEDGHYLASPENPVIIFDDFTGAFKWVDFEFKVKSSAMKMLTADTAKTSTRYVFHLMGKLNFSSSEHKRLWIGTYSEFLVPVPPLPVQEEIVRILDSFTQLTAELQAELQARRIQYDYYLEILITSCNGCKKVKISDVCGVYDGTHQTPKYTESGVKFVSVENIDNLYGTQKYISEEAYSKYKIKPRIGDVLMTRITAGVIGKCTVIDRDEPLAYYVSLALLRPDSTQIDGRYLKYYIESGYGKKELRKFILTDATPPKINKDAIGKVIILVPSLQNQHRIISTIERFDKLCSSLTEGIPAEIEARQKQYEYYRDKLLTFKELS